MTMRGLTAAYLMRRIHPWKAGDTLLLHAAAGGLGLMVSQWARLLGLTVIGTVSSAAKAAIARRHGCAHAIDRRREDWRHRVRELTGGAGVSVVFDSVGRSTFAASLDALRRRGLLVCVGTASGPVPPFDPQVLARKGSLFLTRPALADYIADPAEKHRLWPPKCSTMWPPGASKSRSAGATTCLKRPKPTGTGIPQHRGPSIFLT